MENVKLPTLGQMEKMTTHQLSDWLANFVMLLRRMPDVPISDFALLSTGDNVAEKVRRVKKTDETSEKDLPDWSKKE